MEDIWTQYANDILGNRDGKRERKRKMHSLLDKYKDDVQALEDNPEADGIDFMFAKDVLDEVLEERRQKQRDEDETESNIKQVMDAIGDLYRNYKDMKQDNTVGSDDYFHCKANFEAAKRGKYGEKTAELLGNAKERVDYFKNRIFRNLSPFEAYLDYLHDKDVNLQGRQQVKSSLYNDSRDACKYHRVKGINEKY
ncbi:MAG: hypothetical protein NC218_11065 [Acetobacter sp.]|nr:hypothetical protein [Acetobacter sp.]